MAIGDENNNYLNLNFNTFYSNNSNNNNNNIPPSISGPTSQLTRSTSANSIVSICTNVSCSSISTLFDSELMNDNDLKLIPMIPSEDVDEDWLQFGYLLENEENILPKFEHIHHHHNRQQRLQNMLLDGRSGNEHNFRRSFSIPLTPNSQRVIPSDDFTASSEGSEFSFPSLRVEPPLTPPPSPLSSWNSIAMPCYDSDLTITTCPEKPFTKEEEFSARQSFNTTASTSFSNDDALTMSDFNRDPVVTEASKRNVEADDDEPVAKRTRRRSTLSSSNCVKCEKQEDSLSSYYRMSPRPWWMDKLIAMRRQNASRSRKRKTAKFSKSTTRKATKRQLPKKDANFNAEDSFSLCDPRYISLGGNTIPFEEMPMKMELDLSGNAKITTQSDLLNNKSSQNDSNIHASTGGSGANEENDESDDDDDSASNSKALSSKVSEEIGNDESENDSATAGGDTSADEDMDYSRTAKFASLSTTRSATARARNTPRDTMAERKRVVLEKKHDREQKKASVKKTQAQKSRAVGQQHRRDRERRIQMIQMRKMNSSGTDDNGTANTKTLTQRNKTAVAAVVKKSTVRKSIFAEKDNKDTGPAKYCPCGGSYDPKKVYVSCKQCSRWYHCKCAGVTEKRAQKLAGDSSSEWTCSDCEKSSSAEVYCVCRRPYDDSRFYVGCDSCEDWFHPECIGTTQAEVSKHDTFLCPRCRDDI